MNRPVTTSCRSSSEKKSCLGAAYRDAFTLVELLTVIGIVAVLASLLLPALTRSREQARSTVCRNNMKQLTYGVFSYAHEKEDELPTTGPATTKQTYQKRPTDWVVGGPGELPSKTASKWTDPKFPFHAESGSIFNYVTDYPREEIFNEADPRVFKSYRCPSSDDIGAALRVNYSLNGYLNPERKLNKNSGFTRGQLRLGWVTAPSEKVLFVNENPFAMSDAAFEPVNKYNTAGEMFLMHNRSANFSFFDGSVVPVQGEAMLDVVKTMNRLDRHFDPLK
jgi:prepilin-type N-terminal cleavage/methylation domain-containing protein/prepilin-type processing-associated H-X9-DG protein